MKSCFIKKSFLLLKQFLIKRCSLQQALVLRCQNTTVALWERQIYFIPRNKLNLKIQTRILIPISKIKKSNFDNSDFTRLRKIDDSVSSDDGFCLRWNVFQTRLMSPLVSCFQEIEVWWYDIVNFLRNRHDNILSYRTLGYHENIILESILLSLLLYLSVYSKPHMIIQFLMLSRLFGAWVPNDYFIVVLRMSEKKSAAQNHSRRL